MTEPSCLAAVRQSYDNVAAGYVERVMTPAEMDPLSRAMLAAFAELVRVAGRGPAADLGCGPGRLTAQLAMPGLPAVFAEFHRTLAPGGYPLLGGHAGDEHLRPARGYGHPVSYEWYLQPLDRMAGLLGQAGLAVTALNERASGWPGAGVDRARRTRPSGVGECGAAGIGAWYRLGREAFPETGRVAVLPLSARRTGDCQRPAVQCWNDVHVSGFSSRQSSRRTGRPCPAQP